MAHVRIPLCFVWYVEFLNLATLTYLRVDKSLYNEKPHHLIYLSLFNNYNFGIMHLGTVNHFMTMTDSCQMLSSVHTGDRRDLCASVLFYIPLLREVWSSSSSYVLIAWRKSSYYAQPSPAQPNPTCIFYINRYCCGLDVWTRAPKLLTITYGRADQFLFLLAGRRSSCWPLLESTLYT